MRKKIIILGFIFLSAVFFIGIYFVVHNKNFHKINKNNSNSKNNYMLPIPSKNSQSMQIRTKDGKVIKINNLYKKPIKEVSLTEKVSIKEIKIKQTSDYIISFYPKNYGFLITILGSNFAKTRKEAEQIFLKELGINQKQACKLQVEITVPYFVSEKFSGVYPLSFCKSK